MKEFKIEVVLSAVTGKLVCDIGEVYEVLNFLTGDNLYTHQLPRAGQVCRIPVFKQHPFLKDIDLSAVNPENWQEVLNQIKAVYPNMIPLTPIKNWTSIDPLEELGSMVGDKTKIITATP